MKNLLKLAKYKGFMKCEGIDLIFMVTVEFMHDRFSSRLRHVKIMNARLGGQLPMHQMAINVQDLGIVERNGVIPPISCPIFEVQTIIFKLYSLRPKISAVLHYSCSTFDYSSYLKNFYD